MPVTMNKKLVAGELHPTPFVGPIDHPATVTLDVSSMNTEVVDSQGYLKPGVLLTRAGKLLSDGYPLTSPVLAAASSGSSDAGHYGYAGFIFKLAGIQYTVNANTKVAFSAATAYGANKFGAVLVQIDVAGTASTKSSSVLNTLKEAQNNVPVADAERASVGHFIFTGAVTLGTTALTSSNTTFVNYGSSYEGYGAVVEAAKVAKSNTTSELLKAEDFDIVVAPICMLNRAILEDSLGRVLNRGELHNMRDSVVIMNDS